MQDKIPPIHSGDMQRCLQELTERYATPLPEMEDEVDVFASTVKGHLQQML